VAVEEVDVVTHRVVRHAPQYDASSICFAAWLRSARLA
jgi:hypothetical protein